MSSILRRRRTSSRSQCELTQWCGRRFSWTLLLHLAFEDFTVLHHKQHVPKQVHVFQWIARNGNDVGIRAGRDDAQFARGIEQLRSARSGGLDRLHRRHAELHHAAELLRDGFAPGKSAYIGAESNFHISSQSFAERRSVNFYALAVAA